ncbi:hypothetical protein BS78_08G030200 [Paspalum vaginatum]|nr:hypothetical protein BS78_08G030200 [Paspalum vaginatum]
MPAGPHRARRNAAAGRPPVATGCCLVHHGTRDVDVCREASSSRRRCLTAPHLRSRIFFLLGSDSMSVTGTASDPLQFFQDPFLRNVLGLFLHAEVKLKTSRSADERSR